MKNLVFLLLLLSLTETYAQISKSRLHSEFAKAENRLKYTENINREIETLFGNEPLVANEKKWDKLLYEISVDLYKHPLVEKAVAFLLSQKDEIPEKLSVRAILTARALYPDKFELPVQRLFNETERAKTALFAFHYLYFYNSSKYKSYLNKLLSRFGDYFPVKLTEQFITKPKNFFSENELKAVFSDEFLKGELVIYTIFRADRRFPGITLIRKPDEKFLTRNDTVWYVRQLGYSVTDFPYYLQEGNTPQGLFAFEGFYQSAKKSIGPTPVPIIRLPFEISAEKFSGKRFAKWSKENYASLFPKKLRDTENIYETYFAGKTGRNLIVMHGSADNPELYKNKSYFPFTPSTGCITSIEKWDSETGALLKSDQLKLVNAILATKRRHGYLFVMELNNKQKAVTIGEILSYLNR